MKGYLTEGSFLNFRLTPDLQSDSFFFRINYVMLNLFVFILNYVCSVFIFCYFGFLVCVVALACG